MNLIVLGQKIPCVKAGKDETSGTVCAWNAQGSEVFSAQKVTDFSIFAVENGTWSEIPPTTEERLDRIESSRELSSAIYLARLQLAGETVDTDDKRIRASGLYPDWAPGNHPKGEIYNAVGQTWECFSPYDNAVYPDIRPGEEAWYTFNRPLHGTSPETARPWCKPRHGATDIYHPGECMIWLDGSIRRCLRDTDFSPEEYPADWEFVSKSDT